MKGLSVCFTVLLLVLAQWLALHLKRAGALPGQPRSGSSFMALNPAAVTPAHALPARMTFSL